MNRKLIVVWIMGLLFLSLAVAGYPQDSSEQVDWDKLESRLYEKLKTEGGKSDAEIHQAIGYALLNSYNKWERATVHFKRAVELEPKMYFAWYCLGLINIDTEEGNGYFRKAIEANPAFSPSYYWLAYTYCRQRKDKEAIPIWEKYIEVAKNYVAESARLEVAKRVLKELRSGKDGEELEKIRKTEELTSKDVKGLYAEFKNSIVTPLNPDTVKNIKDYKIDNARQYLEKTVALQSKINDLLFSAPDESIKKYGDLLHIMRDVLALDASNLKLLLDGKFARDVYWYELHNKWVKEAKNIYIKLFNE